MKQLGVQNKITISKDEDDEASVMVIRVSNERQIGLLGIEEEVRAFCALEGYSVKRIAADEWLAVDRQGRLMIEERIGMQTLQQAYYPLQMDMLAKTIRRLLDTLCVNKADAGFIAERLGASGQREIQITERPSPWTSPS